MTLTELIRKYGATKGEKAMWESVDLISNTLQDHLTDEEFCSLKKKMHYIMSGGHYDKEFAELQMPKLYYEDTDGTKHYAPYWTEDEVKTLYSEI